MKGGDVQELRASLFLTRIMLLDILETCVSFAIDVNRALSNIANST